jgi:hypothetical protein
MAVAGSAALLLSCSSAGHSANSIQRMDPALQRIAESRPDSLVGVLIRLSRDIVEGDTADLSRLGVTLGSARGRIVTGQMRAAGSRRLASHPIVVWVELSGDIRVNRDE